MDMADILKHLIKLSPNYITALSASFSSKKFHSCYLYDSQADQQLHRYSQSYANHPSQYGSYLLRLDEGSLHELLRYGRFYRDDAPLTVQSLNCVKASQPYKPSVETLRLPCCHRGYVKRNKPWRAYPRRAYLKDELWL